jgi:hypothetical protein
MDEALVAEHVELAAAWHVRPALAHRLAGLLPDATVTWRPGS